MTGPDNGKGLEPGSRTIIPLMAGVARPRGERQVLMLRYGLHDQEPKTLEEIGRRLGLTRERVRQIELESLRRLATLREMQYVAG